MAATPNLRGMARAGYLAGGAALALWGVFGASAGWAQIVWLALGGAVTVEGLIGFSLVVCLLGKIGKTADRTRG